MKRLGLRSRGWRRPEATVTAQARVWREGAQAPSAEPHRARLLWETASGSVSG